MTAFNDLLLRLEQNIGAQKRFIGDAAHQLKTPLAGLRTQAELALKEGDANELRSSLRYIASSAERSARMVSQLLSLARMENLRDAALFEAARPRGAGAGGGRRMGAAGAARAASTSASNATVATAPVEGLPLLLRELMNNLIDNALQHTPRDGSVTVRVSRVAADAASRPRGSRGARRHPARGRGHRRRHSPRPTRRASSTASTRCWAAAARAAASGLAIVLEIADQHQASVSVRAR